jgi:hypothetical protein
MIGKRLLGAIVVLWLAFSPLSVRPASAVFITGSFDLTLALAQFDINADTIGFFPGATITNATGSFAALNNTVVVMAGEGTPPSNITYTDLAAFLGVTPLLTGNNGLSLTVLSNSNTETAAPTLIIDGTGIFALDSFDATPARFLISTQNVAGTPTVTYSANFVAVPGPIVGAGLPGLILACGAMIMLARRRRKFA